MIGVSRARVSGAVASLVAMASIATAQAAPGPSTADVAAAASPATVTILALDTSSDTLALGSGFLIRESGVIVTNFHVLRGASAAVVVLSTRERYDRVSVLDADSLLDLALLKIPGAGLPTLPTRTTIPRVGEKVIAIGSPLGLSQTVSEGIVSATRMVDGHQLVQITAPISHGSSGGAVLDATGRVFAVSTSLLAEGQSLNFAVPVRYALGLLGDNPRARSVAEVFSGSARKSRSGRESASSSVTRRASTPRTSVDGTYAIVNIIFNSADSAIAMEEGTLIATSRVGWLVFAGAPGDSLSRSTAYRVDRWATAANGDVVLVSGDATWDGYQTEDGGFMAHARIQTKEGTFGLSLGATPEALPLSRNDGLYRVSVRTRYMTPAGVITDAWTQWNGELAVAVTQDTINVSMYLGNQAGGSLHFVARGPLLVNGRFDLKGQDGSRLLGSINNGVLDAAWRDEREKGAAFLGSLHAERR
jgi:S1-C subfamily serine protease